MSFTFNWPRFSDQFHYDAMQMLNTALNKGNKPPIIADKIEVVELEMGTQPPELEIRDIGDLTVDQFRGIFRLTYAGDAHLVLKTKVQANPLNHKQPDIHLMVGSGGMLAAKQPLVVPMLLRLSHFRLSSYVVLVVSKQKGITLVFKTDPLQNVDINSTFDSIAVIQKFIQREIEGQLRQMFREDLPGIIHRLSQQWVKAKVEAPYLSKHPPPPIPRSTLDAMSSSSPDLSSHRLAGSDVGLHPHLMRQQSMASFSSRRPRSTSGMSVAGASRPSPSLKSTPVAPLTPASDPVSFPDLENFDPTYGLRPEGLPTKSVFRGFSSLFSPNKGLADLAEEISEPGDYGEEGGSFDFVDWEDTIPGVTPPQSVYDDHDSSTEYETVPAVGGGTVTRPRVYHSQSAIQPAPGIAPSKSFSSIPNRPRPQRSGKATPNYLSRHSAASINPSFPEYFAGPSNLSRGFSAASLPGSSSQIPYTEQSSLPRRPRTPDSIETPNSQSSNGVSRTVSTPPTERHEDDGATYMRRPTYERRLSISSSNLEFPFGSPPNHHSLDPDPKIVLRPSLNNASIHQLSTLSHSNHTLSPYTRSLSHFTVRSVPPRGIGPSGLSASFERQPVKAKRKRTYRLGGRKPPPESVPAVPDSPERASSPIPPSEFDESDMDRYFRSYDDHSRPPNIRQYRSHLHPS